MSDGPDGQRLTWTVEDLAADTDYTLSFRTTPGLELGDAAATARVEIASGAATTAGRRARRRRPAMPRATPASAPPVESDVLYLGYIDGEDDVDLYGFDSTPLAQVGVRLSHLAGDGDLVVYGPATDRPGNSPSPVPTRTAQPSAPPIAAEDLDVSGAGYAPEPDADAGVPILDGLTVVGRSAARNADVEAVDVDRARSAAGQLVQRGDVRTSRTCCACATSTRRGTPACTAYARTGGVAGTMPDLAALPAGSRRP